jgi:hypothetical protein
VSVKLSLHAPFQSAPLNALLPVVLMAAVRAGDGGAKFFNLSVSCHTE